MNLPDDADKDQTNCPDGYYRRHGGMLHQIPAQLADDKSGPFNAVQLSDDDLGKLALDKLSAALQSIDPVLYPSMTCKLADTILDRLKGKPGQQITMDQTLKVITVDCNITFIQPKSESLLIDHVDKPQAIE